jgi:hypothetical protein
MLMGKTNPNSEYVVERKLRQFLRKCSCAVQSDVSIQPLEIPTKPPAIASSLPGSFRAGPE